MKNIITTLAEFFKTLLQLTISPENGWEDEALEEEAVFAGNGTSIPEDKIASVARAKLWRIFLPLIALAALSTFVRIIYSPVLSWWVVLQNALVLFLSFFMACQVSRYAMTLILPRVTAEGYRSVALARSLNVIIYSLSFVALMAIVINLVKIDIMLLNALPFYSVVIIWKSARYLYVKPEEEVNFMVSASVAILGTFYLGRFLFGLIL